MTTVLGILYALTIGGFILFGIGVMISDVIRGRGF